MLERERLHVEKRGERERELVGVIMGRERRAIGERRRKRDTKRFRVLWRFREFIYRGYRLGAQHWELREREKVVSGRILGGRERR